MINDFLYDFELIYFILFYFFVRDKFRRYKVLTIVSTNIVTFFYSFKTNFKFKFYKF